MIPGIFRSTTLRLTGWYLLILMSLSILFSVIVYQVSSDEIQTRLEHFQSHLTESQDFYPITIQIAAIRTAQINEARNNISIELVYINLAVLAVGGLISYILARRSLLPIERAHQAESRFTSDASHELRTPLAIMKTEIEVALKDEAATTKSLKAILSSNLEEVNRLSKLAETLLAISKLDHTKLKTGLLDLNKVCRLVVKSFKQPSNRLVIKSNRKIIIQGNEATITELIKVLIDNALQYSPNDSQVTINIFKNDKSAKFKISNHGPGIPADKLPYIFERFYRADSSRNNGEHKGYGLGLALAKSIVDLHHGELIASSTPGAETTFTCILPIKLNS
jgi:signal transduction histidine kinase